MTDTENEARCLGLEIVALGGGCGLAASLSALRRITPNICAVVSVADNGGSTGRLRESSEQAAPGDLRKCLVALAEPESALARAMEFRFEGGELDGHALGNLLLSAMAQVCDGLPTALEEIRNLLGLTGHVFGVTSEPVDLVAETREGLQVHGQVAIMETADVQRVWVSPREAVVDPLVLKMISNADVIVLGPGSLYTSVLATAAIPAVVAAIAEASAPVVYICNLAPQRHETEGYAVDDHVEALHRHGLYPDVVLFDPDHIAAIGQIDGLVGRCLTAPAQRSHDAQRLESALREVFERMEIAAR